MLPLQFKYSQPLREELTSALWASLPMTSGVNVQQVPIGLVLIIVLDAAAIAVLFQFYNSQPETVCRSPVPCGSSSLPITSPQGSMISACP